LIPGKTEVLTSRKCWQAVSGVRRFAGYKVSKHCTDGAGYPEKAECGDPMDTASSHKDVTERHRGTIIIKGGGEFPAMINECESIDEESDGCVKALYAEFIDINILSCLKDRHITMPGQEPMK
jgi:hypothetical protein